MSDQQFGVLVVILLLGFGGAFAGAIFTLEGVMIGVAIVAVIAVIGFVIEVVKRAQWPRVDHHLHHLCIKDAETKLNEAREAGDREQIRQAAELVEKAHMEHIRAIQKRLAAID